MSETTELPDEPPPPAADPGPAGPGLGPDAGGPVPPGGGTDAAFGGTTPPGAGPPPFGGWTPPPGWRGPARPAMLRRSREDRVAVGLCGGLGRYFGVDPVIFRVVFGVLALFGGSGVVLYLLGWAAIPDEDTTHAPVDRAIAGLRRRHVPVSVVLIVGLVLVWGIFFSWWAPFSFVPALALVAVIALLLMRGGRPIRVGGPDPAGAGWTPPPSYAPYSPPPEYPAPEYPAPDYSAPGYTAPDRTASASYPATGSTGAPSSGSELRAWFHESRARTRARQQRRRPIERAALLACIGVLGVLVVRDVIHGVALKDYFLVLGGIVFTALLVGGVLRRTPWTLAPLLIPAAIGLFVFGSSSASAHDGWGDRTWTPADAGVTHQYDIAFGRGTLDLTGVPAPTTATATAIRMGAGQVRIIVPKGLPVQVVSNVHVGNVEVDATPSNSGVDFTDTYLSPAARTDPTAPRLTVRIRLASGEVSIADGR